MKIKQVKSQYTPEQVSQYLEHIKFPNPPSVEEITAGSFQCTLENLAVVARSHIIAIPFENTDMHYNTDHLMDVSPQGIFKRVVLDGLGNGSFCYGMNGLLLEMLRGLGYRAYAAPARVNNCQPPSTDIDLTPAGHMVILTQPLSPSLSPGSNNPDTYLVDVGFGGFGLARPIPLIEGAHVKGTSYPEEHRLTRDRHPLSSLEPTSITTSAGAGEEKHQNPELEWRLEYRCGTFQPAWRVVYQFSLKESFQGDREAMAFATAGRPGIGPFWTNVLVIAHFPVEGSEDEDDMGRMVLFGKRLDRRIGDKSEKLAELKTEDERIRALKRYFEISIPEENAINIRGRLAELQ